MASVNIGTPEAPLMVPEGSPGALNYQQNIAPATVPATAPVVAPVASPLPTVALTPPTAAPNALMDVYNRRPDLQAVYNPDGTAKNINDPRVAGIPTLADWSKLFGVNEEPGLNPTVQARTEAANQANQAAEQVFNELGNKEIDVRDSSKLLADALTAINKSQEERKGLTQSFSQTLAPTPEETTARERLAAIQNKSRGLAVSTTAGLLDIKGQPIPMRLIQGQSGQLAQQAELQFQTLGIQEQAAIDAVNLFVNDRNQRLKQYEFLLSENAQQFDQTLGIFEMMRGVAAEERAEARQTLNDMLTFSEGKSWNELDGATQSAIRDSIKGTKITEGMIRSSLGATNRQFAQEIGVVQPFYFAPDGRTAINAATGEAVDFKQYMAQGGKGDFSDIQKIDANTVQERKEVAALRLEYFDAGITLQDSLATATAKIKAKSAKYQKAVFGDPLDKLRKQLEIEKLRKEIEGVDPAWKAEVLSPTEAKTLGVPYGTTKGQAADAGIVPTTPLSSEAVKLKGNASSALRSLGTMKKELFEGANENTPIDQLANVKTNVLGRAALPFKFAGTYTTAEREIKDVLVRMRTGAAISAEEETFYQKQLPGIWDNEATVKYKLKLFEDLFTGIVPTRLQEQSETDNLFNEFESSPSSEAPSVDKIAAAMRQVESGNNYTRKGASGEYGAYQFMPGTWKSWAGHYLSNPNAPMTKENQDTVALAKIEDLLSQGHDAEAIALIWNGGEPKRKKGVNSKGVAYDSGRHADKVLAELKKLG